MKELYLLIKNFLTQLKDDSISAFAAQSAFFLILSAAPLFSLLLPLIQLLPVSETAILDVILSVMPSSFETIITSAVNELFSQRYPTLLSVSALVALWSAGKAVTAMIHGLNAVYHVTENRNYLVLRIVSVFYMIIFLLAFLSTLVLMVLGNTLYSLTKKYFPLFGEFVGLFLTHKWLLTICILILFFVAIYRLVPNSTSILYILPGAVFSSVGWVVFSFLFSIYIENFTRYSYTYGSISAVMLVMLWMYICMYILLIGAEINQYFQLEFQVIFRSVKKRTHR